MNFILNIMLNILIGLIGITTVNLFIQGTFILNALIAVITIYLSRYILHKLNIVNWRY